MPGRHQVAPSRRPALRWLAGAAGAGLLSALLLAFFPANAGAAADPVKATFSVTGVSTSNCPVSVGGSDVYVKPGQNLVVKSSLVGLTAGGVPLDLSKVASFVGGLTITRPGTDLTVPISDNNQTIGDLSNGDHAFTWKVTGVKLLGGLGGVLPAVPLGLT